MGSTNHLLKHLCTSERHLSVAEMLNNPNQQEMMYQEFWTRINNFLVTSYRYTGFDYHEVAACHVMCVASAPHCTGLWLKAVLEELRNRYTGWGKNRSTRSLDTYEMGSLIGLFQAGCWLQKNSQQLLNPDFLSEMSNYCIASIGNAVNVSYDEPDMVKARRQLDESIKTYLRPKNQDLALRLTNQMRPVLSNLQESLSSVHLQFKTDFLIGPGSWILDGFVHGILDVEHRKTHTLLPAVLTLL